MAPATRSSKTKASEGGKASQTAEHRSKKTQQQIADEGTTDSEDGVEEVTARTPPPEVEERHHLMYNRDLPLPKQTGILAARYYEANRYWEDNNLKLRNAVAHQKKLYRVSVLKKRGTWDKQFAAGEDKRLAVNDNSGVQLAVNGQDTRSTSDSGRESGLNSATASGHTSLKDQQEQHIVQPDLPDDAGAKDSDIAVSSGTTAHEITEMQRSETGPGQALQEDEDENVEAMALDPDNNYEDSAAQNNPADRFDSDVTSEMRPVSLSGSDEADYTRENAHQAYGRHVTSIDEAVVEIARLNDIIHEKDRKIKGEQASNDFYLRRKRQESDLRQRVLREKNEEIRELKHKFGQRVDLCKCSRCETVKREQMTQRYEASKRERAKLAAEAKSSRK